MARPKTIAEYIQAAPAEGRPNLRKLHALLRKAAPKSEEAIKWGAAFYVEPRFLFAFSAHKAHANFVLMPATVKEFSKELKGRSVTKGALRLPYSEKLPEALIRKLALHRVKLLKGRDDDSFW